MCVVFSWGPSSNYFHKVLHVDADAIFKELGFSKFGQTRFLLAFVTLSNFWSKHVVNHSFSPNVLPSEAYSDISIACDLRAWQSCSSHAVHDRGQEALHWRLVGTAGFPL